MSKPKVYLETSIPSYLTARPNADPRTSFHRDATRDWWENRRHDFELFVSGFVIGEARSGDPEVSRSRLEAIKGIAVLEAREDALALAKALIANGPIPAKAEMDAIHIAMAAYNGIEYLLTWNCRHIANAAIRARIESICREFGYEPPIMCTPLELMEG